MSPDSHRDPGIDSVTMVIQRLRPLFSGQGVQVESLCRDLAARGVDTTILTAVQGRHQRWERVVDGPHGGCRVRRLRCDIPPLSRWLRPRRFRSEVFGLRALGWLILHGWHTRIVHVHALTDALYTSWLFCKLRRIPIIFEMTLIGADDPLTAAAAANRVGRARTAIYRRCDGYVAISPALADAYERAGLPVAKLRVIPQGVDTERFAPSPDVHAVRSRLGLPPSDPLLVFVGSLIERKGVDVLLAAWQRISDALPAARLAVVGNDTFESDPAAQGFLDREVAKLTDASRSRLHRFGVRDDVEGFLQAADVFVFPSRREGFGTVMIEAMACGLPCVVAALPGITDFIFATESPDPCGVVIPQDDPEALAGAVTTVLTSPDGARHWGTAARRRACERFSSARIAEDYLEFYAELGAGRTTGTEPRP